MAVGKHGPPSGGTQPGQQYEGHGEDSKAPGLKKGTFQQIGTWADLSSTAISPNKKSGTSSGGEQ